MPQPLTGTYLPDPDQPPSLGPTVRLDSPISGSVGAVLSVKASAHGPVADTGAGYSWTVDFGDGSPSTERPGVTSIDLPHRYSRAGSFLVTATVVDGFGRSGSASARALITSGCGCSADPLQAAWLLGLMVLRRRRVRPSC